MTGFLQMPPTLDDAWASDRVLREAVEFHLGGELFPAAEAVLSEMGRRATAPETIALAMRAEREPPVHIPFAPWGERIDEIRVSDAYTALGRMGVAAGVTALPYESSPFGALGRVVWGALMTLWGPSSALYSCPVAMTDAAARTLLLHGGPESLDVVSRLTTRDPDRAWTSGQWMTETAGGSDVGRTGTVAVQDGGVWRLTGTKWFTSATTSEMALTLARPVGGAEGSRGLALFRIQRTLDDGTRNAIVVRRLKDKLGTRSLPTAELELEGAIAWPVGDPADGGGVRRIATMLNITRVHNAIGSAGALARGLSLARAYASVREVFGRSLAEMPAHRATLTDLAVDYAASIALVMRCCELTGRAEQGEPGSGIESLLRGLTPVAKLATARWAVAGAAESMEAIGGVGYCEDSGVPALVRNAHVMPIWEGTTNVLSLDLLRAAQSSGSLQAIVVDARQSAGEVAGHPAVADAAAAVAVALDAIEQRAVALIGADEDALSDARSIAMSLASTYACARLCLQGAWAADKGDGRTAAAARRMAARGLLHAPGPLDLELAMDDPLRTPETMR
ncbi:MAG TPA: acyl-CoA dehydrogenase family protein [Actinomycetota bacterium]|nr:acyl-CoA dehydrogenase family protein [Actinomycetota bacterium]